MAYGYCPHCGAPVKSRERRLNGDDTCEAGHKYPSRKSLREKPTPKTIPMPVSREHAEMMLLVSQRYLDDNPEDT